MVFYAVTRDFTASLRMNRRGLFGAAAISALPKTYLRNG
jgi:hypothetical protein